MDWLVDNVASHKSIADIGRFTIKLQAIESWSFAYFLKLNQIIVMKIHSNHTNYVIRLLPIMLLGH